MLGLCNMREVLTCTGGGVPIIVIAEKYNEELVNGRQRLPSTTARKRQRHKHMHTSVLLQTQSPLANANVVHHM